MDCDGLQLTDTERAHGHAHCSVNHGGTTLLGLFVNQCCQECPAVQQHLLLLTLQLHAARACTPAPMCTCCVLLQQALLLRLPAHTSTAHTSSQQQSRAEHSKTQQPNSDLQINCLSVAEVVLLSAKLCRLLHTNSSCAAGMDGLGLQSSL